MVTSDISPEVEIRPFRACAMKNMQYNPYLWPDSLNFRVLKKIGVQKHDGDVRFKSGSGNMAVSWICTAFGHIIGHHCELATGQIPCSTEPVSSY